MKYTNQESNSCKDIEPCNIPQSTSIFCVYKKRGNIRSLKTMTAYKNLIPINKLYLIANDSEKIINIQVSTEQDEEKENEEYNLAFDRHFSSNNKNIIEKIENPDNIENNENNEKKEKKEKIENFENSTNEIKKKKKGKSVPLPGEAEECYSKIKSHFEERKKSIPSIFRKDGIRKKIKTHFFQWMKKLLESQLKKVLGEESRKFRFKKLNQNTIASINLKVNSDLLQKTVFEVYSADSEDNSSLILKLKGEEFLNFPLHILYDDYLKGKQFLRDFKKIERKINSICEFEDEEDRPVILLYLKVYKDFSENFIHYFMYTSPNQRSSLHNRRPNKCFTEYEYVSVSEEAVSDAEDKL